MTGKVALTKDRMIATLTLSNPRHLNAMTPRMWQGLKDCITEVSQDRGIRCVVLRGDGPNFVSGADISVFDKERADSIQAKQYEKSTHLAISALQNCPHPTIALIEGVCIGGGMEIACVCDIRIAGESSKFGITGNRLGLSLGEHALKALVAVCGRSSALEIMLEGRIFGSKEAATKGFLNKIVPDGKVNKEVYQAARHIADRAPLSNRWHKEAILSLESFNRLDDHCVDSGYRLFDSADYKEGVRAFLKKEKPSFKGH